jgi:hypothetical protein
VINNTLPPTDDAVVERVTVLADHYADEIVVALPTVESEDGLRRVLSGAFIAFLVEVLTDSAA